MKQPYTTAVPTNCTLESSAAELEHRWVSEIKYHPAVIQQWNAFFWVIDHKNVWNYWNPLITIDKFVCIWKYETIALGVFGLISMKPMFNSPIGVLHKINRRGGYSSQLHPSKMISSCWNMISHYYQELSQSMINNSRVIIGLNWMSLNWKNIFWLWVCECVCYRYN